MSSDCDGTLLNAQPSAAACNRMPSVMNRKHIGVRHLNETFVFAPGSRSPFVNSSYCLFLLSLVAIAWLGQRAMAQQAHSRPFWPEIRAFLEQDRVAGFKPCRTLFVGSSSIRFWVSLARDLPKRNVIRRGFGGAHLTHVVQYFDLLIKPHKPSEIVVYAGENDIASGRSPGELLATLKTLLKLKSRSLDATPVYFIAIKPSLYHWDKFATQTRANALIKEITKQRDDLVFVDIVPLMLKNGIPKAVYVADGLHMNRDGYAIWAKAVSGALDKSAVPTAARCAR